ncbi:MAG: UvrD-helicase domain-containing protein [Flavobacteriales bacterium]|nr:UvrD-helicase domain-containing protein [Flavobacteriales bacterium]
MFKVLRSSAGAGKTHALVKHYLALCLATNNTAAYRQVLALTFTNKAASEMKERVLRYLEQLARRETSSASLRDVMEHLKGETGVDEEVVALRAASVLKHMLHHAGEVSISTIDAFTRQVVRPFARDLRLDHELRMTTEQDWYRDRAVDDVIAEAGTNPAVTALLTEAAQQLLEDAGRWDPGVPLRELGKELDQERAIGPLAAMEAMDAQEVISLSRRLRQRNEGYRASVQAIGAEAMALIDGAGLAVADLHQTKSGYHGFFTKLAAFGDAWMAPNSYVVTAMEHGTFASAKAGSRARADLESIGPELQAIYRRALEALSQGQRAYFLRKAVLQELPTAFTLRELLRCLEARKREDGVVFFSDLTRRVAELVRDEPVPFIHERMGERYRHFLIDEFQDTSLLQWSTLLPLIHNALGSGGSALLVGDAKQAIYRWRNGEVRLFIELPHLFGSSLDATDREREQAFIDHFMPVAPLVTNYRSSATIIEFNNTLFAALREALPEDLRRVYAAHEQEAHNDRPGLVHLEKQPKDVTGEDGADSRRAFLLRCMEEALADGFLPGDVAVLVRDGRTGREAAKCLTDAGFQVTSPDGLLLGGDPLVEAVIELLRVVHTDDPIAAARFLQQRARLQAEADEVDPHAGNDAADPLTMAKIWLQANGIDGVRTTITELLRRLFAALSVVPAADARALALLDEAHAYAKEHGPDLGGFLEHWDRRGHRRSLSPPADAQAVQVMTIHKAKGLEFPVVIMPNARMAAARAHAERLWVKPGEAISELPYALVTSGALLRTAGVEEALTEESLTLLDHLDLLYVAFTRPAQRLYALVPEGGADSITKALLSHMDDHRVDGALCLGERTGPWHTAESGKSDLFKPLGASLGQPALALRYEAPPGWDPEDPDPWRRMGNVVHAVLSQVTTADQVPPAIAAVREEGLLSSQEAETLQTQLSALIASPDLEPWFGQGLRVRTEATIITANGHALRPDRVVFQEELARVLDIKTGVPREEHEQQVRGYMRLLRDLGHAHVEGALLYVSSGELVTVNP